MGPVQRAIILLLFIHSSGLFCVPRDPFVPVLESPASELRDWTDTGAAAVLVGSGGVALGLGGGPGLPTRQDTTLLFP